MLDDCDNNLDIAIQILQKAAQQETDVPAPTLTTEVIRKLSEDKQTQESPTLGTLQETTQNNIVSRTLSQGNEAWSNPRRGATFK